MTTKEKPIYNGKQTFFISLTIKLGYGVSGVMVLKESHFTIHTWPEKQYAAVDIFLCDTNINIENVVKYLCGIFSTNNYKIKKIDRGVF